MEEGERETHVRVFYAFMFGFCGRLMKSVYCFKERAGLRGKELRLGSECATAHRKPMLHFADSPDFDYCQCESIFQRFHFWCASIFNREVIIY